MGQGWGHGQRVWNDKDVNEKEGALLAIYYGGTIDIPWEYYGGSMNTV